MHLQSVISAFAIALLFATMASAAEPVDDELHLSTPIGAWALSANGTVGVRNLESDVDVSFDDILKKTELAVFPEADLTKGNWLLSFNGVYAKLQDSVTLRDGRGGDIDSDMGIFDLAVGYTIVRTEIGNGMPLTFTPVIGGRVTTLKAEIDPRNFGSASQTRTWFDPYVGGQMVLGLSDKVDWRIQGTFGGFSIGSNQTWSASTFVDWKLNRVFTFDVGYRAMGWNYDLGNFKWDMVFHGPWIGLTVKWF